MATSVGNRSEESGRTPTASAVKWRFADRGEVAKYLADSLGMAPEVPGTVRLQSGFGEAEMPVSFSGSTRFVPVTGRNLAVLEPILG